MKELTEFLKVYVNIWKGTHPITYDVFVRLQEKFKDYD